MAPRTDARARMVAAGEDLLSRRGYGMTMLDVIAEADAPRGSIYYHFPGGKPELVIEVADKVRREVETFVAALARKVDDPAAFLKRLVEHHRKRLSTSGLTLGCPLMGVVITGEAESIEMAEAVERAFTAWVESIAAALASKGFDKDSSRRLATVTVLGVEGAIVLARGRRSTEPFAELSHALPLLVEAMRAPIDR